MHIDGGMALCQTKYIETLLQRFGLEECKPIATPMETGLRVSLHDAEDAFDIVLYHQVVGCLIYVCITRPDIQFAVSQMRRFMHSQGAKHWQAVKRIFRYLSGTRHLGLFYPKGDHYQNLYMLFWTLIGQVSLTHVCPQVDFASCLLVAQAYLG